MKKHCILTTKDCDKEQYTVDSMYDTKGELDFHWSYARGYFPQYRVLDFSENQLNRIKKLNDDEMPYEIFPIKGNKVRIIQY